MRSRAVSPPGAAAGHLGTEGQRARGDQTGTEQLGTCRRDRLPAVNLANPFFGKMSDRTSSKLGMRRPWMAIGLVVGPLGVLVVALAPNIPVVLLGWCIAQVFFNALPAAMVAVLPDQVSVVQRGQVSGVLGVCVPIASVSGTFVVKLFTGNQLTMFLAPCAIGGFFILLLAVTLKDRRLAKADKPSPAASTVSWSGWPSADSASACMRPSTSR
ncbi:MAG TPA: MFS transporter [Kribbella sp.]